MALFIMQATFLQQYLNSWLYSVPKKTDSPLRVGVLSTAQINPASIIHPVETHADVVLYAIASRDASAAKSHASKYRFQKSYGSYESLLEDPNVDFVYISLPNALHFEWAWKSLEAGKHVLLEKPFTNNAAEAAKLAAKAKESGKILMEAFHWRFHPAAHRFSELLNSGELGKIIQTDAAMTSTPGVPSGDIRWQYDLGGGSLMDNSYTVSFTRVALQAETPEEVMHAKASPAEDARVDKSMKATLRYIRPGSAGGDADVIYSNIYTDLKRDWAYGIIPRLWELPTIRVKTEKAEVVFYNAMMAHTYHYIGIKDKTTGVWRYEKVYKGGPLWKNRGESYWSTYRYQLEAFVDRLQGREPVYWVSNEDSVVQMKTLDQIYQKSGLPVRPTSEFAASLGVS